MRFIYVNPETNETTYPFSGFDALRKLHPNVSFPRDPSLQLLAEWGCFEVIEVPQPQANRLEAYVEGPPVVIDGRYTMTWVNVGRTAEETQAYDQAVARRVRARRDALLQRSDFTQLADTSIANPAAWVAYRQALRAVPQQPGFPHNVVWPEVPAGARLEE